MCSTFSPLNQFIIIISLNESIPIFSHRNLRSLKPNFNTFKLGRSSSTVVSNPKGLESFASKVLSHHKAIKMTSLHFPVAPGRRMHLRILWSMKSHQQPEANVSTRYSFLQALLLSALYEIEPAFFTHVNKSNELHNVKSEEIKTLPINGTLSLVASPPGVTSWFYTERKEMVLFIVIKHDRSKEDNNQQKGINYTGIFSLTVKLITIRVILYAAISSG